MESWPCQSCCISCTISPPPSSVVESPFSLHKLLGVGTITLRLPVEKQHQICDHTHAEDGWHHFKAEPLLSLLPNAEDLSLCHELDFLQKQHFISITFNCLLVDGAFMVLRIYLIPYDLGGLKGALRIRKDAVLGPARRYMRNLLPKVSRNIQMWFQDPQAGSLTPAEKECLFLPHGKDSHTLSEIFTNLPSPNPNPVQGCGGISGRLLDLSDTLEGLGMRSTLFPYQRRTVAAMLENELNPTTLPDPLFIPLKTMNDRIFYFQPGTMEVLSEPQETARARGGILCEELGTGKTVMVLTLIMATRNQLSDVEPHIVDTRRVMTPLAFRHFPSGEFAVARKQYLRQASQRMGVPSLVELMLHHARVAPDLTVPASFARKQYREKLDEIDTLPLGDILRANNPFYFHHLAEPTNRERKQRHAKDKCPKIMYLTSATLIVVPANLLSQWDREISKHCDEPLRVLLLRTKTPVPSVQSLATDYDIILMGYPRFTSEGNNQEISQLHTNRMCTCPEIPGSRVPRCKCQINSVSPFLQIRWKRLVIDEGHVSASLSTHLVAFSQLLSVERRWIVTGTPTTHLLGLSLGSKSVEELQTTSPPVDSASSASDIALLAENAEPDEEDEGMEDPKFEQSQDIPEPMLKTRIWNKYDRDDLNKLSNMISHFISVPQFKADPKLITTHVIEPLLDPQGPRPGAIQVLDQVMQMVMIRHRIEDVEKDIILPPVSQESVLLDLDPYMIKSYNALQAVIVINAIDSQRTDQDYMFHPRNADSLQDTVRNMSQICFWHIDDSLYNAEELVSNSEKIVQRAMDRKMSFVDILLLREALKHLRDAIDDPLWKLMQRHEDVPYRVFDMNERIYQQWSRTLGVEPGSAPNQTGFLHADRLLRLHEMVVRKPLAKEEKIIQWGEYITERDLAFRKSYEESQRRKNKARKRTRGANDDTSPESRMADNFAKKASAADTLREIQRVLEITLKREMEEDNEGPSSNVPLEEQTSRPSALLASSPVKGVHIGSSASSKLNYILNEVQKYSPTEKFLIFSESPLTLAHVAEGLELIKVKFLRFTTQINPQNREQLVLTFETSDTYRVFLMELKHGARGLNLISASRVIFCEPVWQPDVESQAIKRAHRIGQTRPIKVKTLAIRGTAEANMVARRIILKNSQEKLPKVIEEAGMRHFIANPKFITHPPRRTPIHPFPLIRLPPEFVAPRPQSLKLRIPPLNKVASPLKVVRVEDPITEGSLPPAGGEKKDGPPPKKKIRFATP